MSLKELLGPLYEKNLPYILAALRGEKQVFERQIRLPGVRSERASQPIRPISSTVWCVDFRYMSLM